MAFRGVERGLERMIEGTFARIFRSGLRPIELERRLAREMGDNRSVDVRGRTVVPNDFTVELSDTDLERFADIIDSLERDLAESARAHARDEGYSFMGPVKVGIESDEKRRTGSFRIVGHMRTGAGGAGGGSLVLATGDRIPLGEAVMSFGRRPESTVQLADPNVSRNHAEIRPQGNGWIVVDLGSTNGTRVNGARIDVHQLHEGDEITFGNTTVTFEAS